MIRNWKREFLENASLVFEEPRKAERKKKMGMKMTGSELQALADTNLKDNAVVYPYMLYSTAEIQNGKTYVVAVSDASLNEDCLTKFTENDAIITNGDEAVTAQIKLGITQFLKAKETTGSDMLVLG